jgi:hypothetical protein
LEKPVDAEDATGSVSFLSPFDNLTWSKPHTRRLFGFDAALEIYVPKENRRFGYYALNILHNNQIIGRLDPKMHRDKATLEIKALEVKEDLRSNEDFKHQFSLALRDFMVFHDAQTMEVAKDCEKCVEK